MFHHTLHIGQLCGEGRLLCGEGRLLCGEGRLLCGEGRLLCGEGRLLCGEGRLLCGEGRLRYKGRSLALYGPVLLLDSSYGSQRTGRAY